MDRRWTSRPGDRDEVLAYVGAAAGCNAGGLLADYLIAGCELGMRDTELQAAVEAGSSAASDEEPVVISGERKLLDVEDLSSSMDKLRRQPSIDRLLEVAVNEVRAMTGFDRVMAYRFRHDDSGDIVAEAEAIIRQRLPQVAEN